MRWRLLSMLIGVLLIGPTALWAAPSYRGMSYLSDFSVAGSVMDSANSKASLLSVSNMGANTIALNVYWFTPSTTSTSIAPDMTRYSSSDSSVANAIDYIHSLGMKVMLKPMVDVTSGAWRGDINPSSGNVSTWFSSYNTFIDHYATMAQQHNVDLFSMGCELNDMEQYTTNWNSMISGVRSIYSGPLTYSSNWSVNSLNQGGFQKVGFWNQLNEIGIDAYFPLVSSSNQNPTEAQLQTAWTNVATNGQTSVSGGDYGIQKWLTQQGYWNLNNPNDPNNKKVLFTEVGYQSQTGTASSPAGTSGSLNIQAQADCYQALLTVMSPMPWYDGELWWAWSTNPNEGGTSNNNFTPHNKPAQQIASQFYLQRGDFNLDHVVTNADLQAMLNALKNLNNYQNVTHFFSNADMLALGDFNSDGVFNAGDLSGMMNLLAGNNGGGSQSAVPEPATCILLLTCGTVLYGIRRRASNPTNPMHKSASVEGSGTMLN